MRTLPGFDNPRAVQIRLPAFDLGRLGLVEDWRGLSVVYLCPIKALLNNLEERLSRYAGLLGRRVAVWHGDISQGERARTAREPPDFLLATAESLEVVLVSRRVDHRSFFNREQHLRRLPPGHVDVALLRLPARRREFGQFNLLLKEPGRAFKRIEWRGVTNT